MYGVTVVLQSEVCVRQFIFTCFGGRIVFVVTGKKPDKLPNYLAPLSVKERERKRETERVREREKEKEREREKERESCLLYTSDAADDC